MLSMLQKHLGLDYEAFEDHVTKRAEVYDCCAAKFSCIPDVLMKGRPTIDFHKEILYMVRRVRVLDQESSKWICVYCKS